MIQSVCILGRQPALGLAELESLYGADAVSRIAPHVAGLTLACQDISFARLGGSTRLASVVTELPGTNWKLIEKELAKLARSYTPDTDGKITLGLSALGFDITPAKLTATGLTLKKILRSSGRSIRLVPNPELELNTAQVFHNRLTQPNGIELLCIATTDNRTVLARTVAVQDIDSYTLRDRGRPKRDARVGMLPPKLAQIIINLATGPNDGVQFTLLDPFCGTGVLLQEAMLMGYEVHGTDIEPRMIDYTRQNIDWLTSKFEIPPSELEAGDATTYSWKPAPQFVACETYLGRPFTAQPDRQTLEQNVADVNTIITKFLRNIHGQLPAGTRLCIAVPAWNLESRISNTESHHEPPTKFKIPNSKFQFRHLPLIDQLSNLGYNRVRFEHVRDDELLYYREDQIVARELLVLQVN